METSVDWDTHPHISSLSLVLDLPRNEAVDQLQLRYRKIDEEDLSQALRRYRQEMENETGSGYVERTDERHRSAFFGQGRVAFKYF